MIFKLVDFNELQNKSFVIFLDRSKKHLVIEHNSLIDSVSQHRWYKHDKIEELDKEYPLEPFSDFRYVIKKLFKPDAVWRDN